MGLLKDTLRGHVRDTESAIVTLNRQVTEASAAGRPTDGLRAQIRTISETRNFILARLRRLDGAETPASASSKTETAALENSP